MSASHRGDVASAIGAQVEQMILQAKKDSEARVRHDLSVARSQLQHMEGMIGELSERVQRCAQRNGPGAGDPSQTVDRPFLSNKISQLEQKWGSEVKALKQDLHRTILAHNHNSDLMRHHRDALDEARRKLDAMTQPPAQQVDLQIDKVERILRAGQTKQRALDALTERLTNLEQQVSDMMQGTGMGASPFPGMMPGMPGMLPYQQAVPPGQQREAAVQGKKKPTAKGEPPTDEEFRQHLLSASRANQGDGASNFNAEAPVFIPRGATSPEAAAPASADAEQQEDEASGADSAKVTMGTAVTAATPAVSAAATIAVAGSPGADEEEKAEDGDEDEQEDEEDDEGEEEEEDDASQVKEEEKAENAKES